VLRVLLVADTHLGFDLPQRPRSERVRRGADFFAALERALAPARRGEVDLVVHGGDLLFRSRVGGALVAAALEPLLEVADRGVPVLLVPGNHERSALPYPLLAAHERLHVFDRPRSFTLSVCGMTVVAAGFPCERDGISGVFAARVAAAGADGRADVRLLCLHQTVEGATVGPGDFVFRTGPDVVPGRAIPSGFAAVLAGHIHRHQVLTRDLAGRALAAPVLYPGSVERTSFAERGETKGYLTLEVEPDAASGGRLHRWELHELPARPMRVVNVSADGLDGAGLRDRLARLLAAQPPDAVVQLRIAGSVAAGAAVVLRAAELRSLHPPSMIVELRLAAFRGDAGAGSHGSQA
jgi:DNA repair exonuclease SbcCD nuclease subunit